MPILHTANKNYSSWSLRPGVLMKQPGIPFDEKRVPFAGSGPESGFLAFSPAALAEPWRDEPHEAEARAVGTWVADLRARA